MKYGVKNIQAAAYNGARTVCGFMANSHKKSWMISILTNCSHVAVVGQYKSVIHNRVSSVTRFPYLKNYITTEYHSCWINRNFLCWLTLKNTFQKEHIPKRDIPFWSHYEKGTFHFDHIPKRGHSKKRQISKRGHSKEASHFEHIFITFQKEHIPKKGTFQKEHIQKRAKS